MLLQCLMIVNIKYTDCFMFLAQAAKRDRNMKHPVVYGRGTKIQSETESKAGSRQLWY